MEIKKLNVVYYSATYTTKKILESITKGFGEIPVQKYDITKGDIDELNIPDTEVLLVGVPVYAGRMPEQAAKALQNIKGNETPAIIVCVYGNRDYDDALLELKDVTTGNGFKIISAGAFVAQHSIFPKLAQNRPDDKDVAEATLFGKESYTIINSITDLSDIKEVQVKGNYPYKEAKPIPLKPKASKKCNKCGTCVRLCPVDAIPDISPRKTDKDKCISCGRCIVVCPTKARNFGGLIYKIAGKRFVKNFSLPKGNEKIFLSSQ